MDRKTIVNKIKKLRKDKNAIILAHNYQLPEIQDIADIVGDSLDLAKKATDTEAENIIFCGVDFMAEAAKILNPEKKVIIPDKEANCPMAAMVTTEDLNKFKEKHPDAKVVAYVNTTAKIKANSDICCTSSNGTKVVKNISADEIIFVPDKNLGRYIQRSITNKKMLIWDGWCYTHNNITTEQLLAIKEKHPKASILVHPECRPEVIDIANQALSTNGMVNYVKNSENKEFIIGTEKELCYRLRKEKPQKEFYPVETAICKDMKKITLEKVLKSLENLEPSVTLSKEIMNKAKLPLQKMMEIGRGD